MSVLTLVAKLERNDSSTPWGFRMQGGKDFSSQLAIQNVSPESLAAKCGLKVGDIILKIGNTSTENLRHKEAQASILDSGNTLDLLLQRIREKGQQNQWGGTTNYSLINGPQIDTSNSWSPQPQTYSSPVSSSQQNFNSAPRPFGSQKTSSTYEPSLSQKTAGLSLSSEPNEPREFQNATEKYSTREDAPDPSQHQSRSFKYLANLMDEGKEINTALKPRTNSASSGGYVAPKPTPVAEPARGPAATPIGPGSKPGMVKALVSQRYNNPIGLYSNENVNNQLEGQSKFLVDDEDPQGNNNSSALPKPANTNDFDEHGRKKYVPSETYRLVQEEVGLVQKEGEMDPVHSRSFKMLQQQLHSETTAVPPTSTYKPNPAPVFQPAQNSVAVAAAAKPWVPPVAPPSAPKFNPSARAPGSTSVPAPTGVGATRGMKGDAAMQPAMLPAAGRVPVCSGCTSQIRGPFVTALGKSWCPDHFVCANPQCGIKLLDIGFVEEGGLLYCERDYAAYFAPYCDRCGEVIVGECVNTMQKSFHHHCFLCAHCKKPIGGTKFYIEEGQYYCETDWAALFQTMCSGCNFPVEPGDKWVEAMGKNYHSECFSCATCQVNLEGQQFCAKGGKAYCKKHAH